MPTPTPLPKPLAGDHPVIAWGNRILQCLRERTPKRGTLADIDFSTDGFRVKPSIAPAGTPGTPLEQFAVIREYQNHIVGKLATADLDVDPQGRSLTYSAEETRIAKPPEFRASVCDVNARGGAGIAQMNGVNYTYAIAAPWGRRTGVLVDAGEFGALQISTDEELVPPYLLAPTETSSPYRFVYASKVKQGAMMRVTEDADPTTYDVEYIDANADGRRWFPVQKKVRVCVEGQAGPWFVLIRCSGSFQEE